MRWHRTELDRLAIVPLDTLTAVFDRGSGDTHIIAEPLPQLLDILSETPLDLASVRAALSQHFELGDDPDAQLVARLEELVALGLVHVA